MIRRRSCFSTGADSWSLMSRPASSFGPPIVPRRQLPRRKAATRLDGQQERSRLPAPTERRATAGKRWLAYSRCARLAQWDCRDPPERLATAPTGVQQLFQVLDDAWIASFFFALAFLWFNVEKMAALRFALS